jgi:phosphonate transport system permease protein
MLNPTLRDPAALPRLALKLLAVLLLWPGLSLSELNLAVLVESDNAANMGRFLADFWPPAHDPQFLRLLGRVSV